LAKRTADLVEEALDLIERGELTLEEGPRRYGSQWPTMRPTVEVALQVVKSSNPPLVSQRPFTPLDKTLGWQSLKAQLEVSAPVASRQLVTATQPTWGWNWLEAIVNSFGTKLGRAALGTMLGLALVIILIIEVNTSLPGDALYRAKLGWDYVGEVVNIDPNDRAQAALDYSQHRLNELEKLAFRGSSDQVVEAQGQYLRGVDASLRYADQKNFSAYTNVYNRLNTQRDQVFHLQQSEYIFGPHSQLNILMDRLNYGVFSLAPRLPGSQPPPVTPTPVGALSSASSTAIPSSQATAATSVTAKAASTPTPTTLLDGVGNGIGTSRLLGPTSTPTPTFTPKP